MPISLNSDFPHYCNLGPWETKGTINTLGPEGIVDWREYGIRVSNGGLHNLLRGMYILVTKNMTRQPVFYNYPHEVTNLPLFD